MKKSITLNTGGEIPILGFGVYQVPPGPVTEASVAMALKAGYRHIDTARFYGNEESVGNAVRASGIPRSEIFVTTKLWPLDYGNPQKAFEISFKKLNLEYIDLYLMHFPVPFMNKRVWGEMEKILAGGKVRAIGVSNFTKPMLERLLETAKVVPAINQVRHSPFSYKKELLEYCKQKGIIVEAYSPLTRGKHLNDGLIESMAKNYGKSPAQILLRWAVQHGLVVLPKSTNEKRIQENAAIFDFEITQEDMKVLDQVR